MNLWMDTAQTRWTARHKQHIGQEACFFAGGSVGTKLGTGIAQASIAGIMSLCGYISSTGSAVVQSQSAINSIINIYMFGPLLIFVGVLIVGLLYQLDKKYPAIMKELAEREARGQDHGHDGGDFSDHSGHRSGDDVRGLPLCAAGDRQL